MNEQIIRRKLFLINKRFQFKFCFIICSLVFLSSLIYPVTIYELITSLTARLPGATAQLSSIRSELITALATFQFVFIFLVFIICVFLTHRVAGPLYKLGKHLKMIGDGQPPEKIKFRKHDYFVELEDYYNSAIKRIMECHYVDFSSLNKLNEFIINNLEPATSENEKVLLQKILDKIVELQEEYKRNNS